MAHNLSTDAVNGRLAHRMGTQFTLFHTIPNHARSARTSFNTIQPAPEPTQPAPTSDPTAPSTGTKTPSTPPAQTDPDTFSGGKTGTKTDTSGK